MIRPLRRRIFREVYRAATILRGESSVFTRIPHLQDVETRTVQEVLHDQREALLRLLRAKITHVPRLRDWSSLAEGMDVDNVLDRLSLLPILEKDELQQRPEQCMAADWDGRRSAKTTGGSTGRAVTVYKNPEAIAQEMAATWLAYGWFGVVPGDPCIRFWGRPARNIKRRLRYALADGAMNRLTLSAFGYSQTDLERYVRTIIRFRPAYLYGYVSALEDLARHVLRSRGRLSAPWLKCVITTSEVLSEPQRRILEEAFGARVQNEYGCGEVGPIAYECPEGSLHLLPTNHYVEILQQDGSPAPPGTPGAVVVTDLTNEAMPLIRYRVGDTAAFGTSCGCGRPFPVLENVFGREYDFVEASGGQRYHGEFFMYLFEDLRAAHPEIGQFQIIQTSSEGLLARLQLNRSGEAPSAAVEMALRKRLPSFDVAVEIVDRIERRPSGKMLVVENRLLRAASEAASAPRPENDG